MCHAIKPLFCGMGINPIVHVLDEDPRGKDLERVLMRLLGTSSAESTSSMKRRLTVGRLTKPPWFILLVTMAYIEKLCPPVLEFRINLDRIIKICPPWPTFSLGLYHRRQVLLQILRCLGHGAPLLPCRRQTPVQDGDLNGLIGLAGRRPGLPIVVCCSSRDELDTISSAVANVPCISLASLDYAYLFDRDGHGT
ncbi:hypothetical protein TB1_039081 [Malus domestica]